MATGSEIETKPGGNSTMVEDVQKVPVNGKTSDFQPEMQSQRVSFKLGILLAVCQPTAWLD